MFLFSEEDFHGAYSKIMLKYFLAEGIISQHSTLIASQDVNPSTIVSRDFYFHQKIYINTVIYIPSFLDQRITCCDR